MIVTPVEGLRVRILWVQNFLTKRKASSIVSMVEYDLDGLLGYTDAIGSALAVQS